MIRIALFTGLVLIVSPLANCADEIARAEVRIGLSPEAAWKAERKRERETYRLTLNGDEAAKKSWEELKSFKRTSILAELAVTEENGALKSRAIKDLARSSVGDDPNGVGAKALVHVAVADGDGKLRDLARKSLAARDDKRSISWLTRAMANADPLVANNAAAAMKAVGGPRVFEIVIEHWKEIWGASPRDHVLFGMQRSYIADYEVSGDSYDPVVRSFFTGTVLDAQVLKVEADVFYVYIRELSGEREVANNPAAWEQWLNKERPRLNEQAKKLREAAQDEMAKLKD